MHLVSSSKHSKMEEFGDPADQVRSYRAPKTVISLPNPSPVYIELRRSNGSVAEMSLLEDDMIAKKLLLKGKESWLKVFEDQQVRFLS